MHPMHPTDLVKLSPLMALTGGRRQVAIGFIDGPVAINHPSFATQSIHQISEDGRGVCRQMNSMACIHGTFVAGILSAKRGTDAPAICPDCTLLVRSIFSETTNSTRQMLDTTPQELATAISDCINAGANYINMSLSLARPSSTGERELEQVLDYAAKRGVIIVAAAGNQGTLGSNAITRHSWVIPVVACNSSGMPTGESNLGSSIGRRGLMAPGTNVTCLGATGKSLSLGGTSVAVPFVTGAIALLGSLFPAATASQLKGAITQVYLPARKTVIPPLLNAWAAYQFLATQLKK